MDATEMLCIRHHTKRPTSVKRIQSLSIVARTIRRGEALKIRLRIVNFCWRKGNVYFLLQDYRTLSATGVEKIKWKDLSKDLEVSDTRKLVRSKQVHEDLDVCFSLENDKVAWEWDDEKVGEGVIMEGDAQ